MLNSIIEEVDWSEEKMRVHPMGIATKKLRDALLLLIKPSEKHLAQIDSIRSRGAATLADADVLLESIDRDGQLFDDAQTADWEYKKVLEAEESLAEQVLNKDYDKSLRIITLRGNSAKDLAAPTRACSH